MTIANPNWKLIILNAGLINTEDNEWTYEDIVEKVAGDSKGLYTVVYREQDGSRGHLDAGQSIKLTDGMKIDADNTSNA